MLKSLSYHPRNLLGEIPDLESKTLLDVGAGPYCYFSWSYVSHIYKRLKITFETEEIKQYTMKLLENTIALDIKYKNKSETDLPELSICGDAIELPFKDKSFDIITMGNLLDYFIDDDWILEEVIGESVRVLKPNGYLMGYVLLHPPRLDDRLRMFKMLFDLPRYFGQRKKYLKVMENQGLEPLKRDIRFHKDTEGISRLTFFFVTQKTKKSHIDKNSPPIKVPNI